MKKRTNITICIDKFTFLWYNKWVICKEKNTLKGNKKMAFALYYDKQRNRLKISANGNLGQNKAGECFLSVACNSGHARRISDYDWELAISLFEMWRTHFDSITTYTQTIDYIKNIDTRIFPEVQVHPLIKHITKDMLSPYEFQWTGINFLLGIKKGIIGDSMGLGKTLQTMYASICLLSGGIAEKILVVCPSAVKFQWKDEIENCSKKESIVVDGNVKKRNKQYDDFFHTHNYDFLIINYEMLRQDIDLLEPLINMHVNVTIADEAHRIKNLTSKTTAAMLRINTEYKFAATGTPIQNSPEELYTLLNWINPNIVGSITEFRKRHIMYGDKYGKHNVELGYRNLDELRDMASSVMLRRLKKDVLKDLPEIIEENIFVEMNTPQKKLYESVQADYKSAEAEYKKSLASYYKQKEKGSSNIEKPSNDNLMGYQYLSLAISDHPALISNSKGGMTYQYKELASKAKVSPKLEMLIKIMKNFFDEGSRIVIFTQYTSMLDILKNRFIKEFNQEPYIIDGRVDAKERIERLEESRHSAGIRDILLMSDAGNYGLNAQHFDVLINYDIPWNPAVLQQRMGRIHRIGSVVKNITVLNMLTKDTLDEVILRTIQKKSAVGDAVA
jgi:SNF2 family DNA or RNA helicase